MVKDVVELFISGVDFYHWWFECKDLFHDFLPTDWFDLSKEREKLELRGFVSKFLRNGCVCWQRDILQFDINRDLFGDDGCNSIIFEVSWEDDWCDEHIDFIDGGWFDVINLKH